MFVFRFTQPERSQERSKPEIMSAGAARVNERTAIQSSQRDASMKADDDARAMLLRGPHYAPGAPDFPQIDLVKDEHCGDALSVTDIFGNGSAVVIHNFLSQSECDALICDAERVGLTSVNAEGYSERIRITSKVTMWGWDLSQKLFQRVQPFLTPKEITISRGCDGQQTVGQPGIEQAPCGTFVPYGCNPTIRLCRYQKGGHFAPHKDGGHDVDFERNLSLKTLMIYLNDDFEGGATSFYTNKQRTYTPGRPDLRTYSFHPKRGDCLLFNSQYVHDGGVLASGTKYIFRSEVMYRLKVPEEEAESEQQS